MKLPSGTPLIRNEPVKNGDVSPILRKVPSPFNGYLAVTGMGYDGFEEGLFLVESNVVTHVYYAHLKYLYEEKGDTGLKNALNVFRTNGANIDLVEFTVPKLKLTASFNEDCRLSKPFKLTDLPKYIPKAYSKENVVKIIKLRPAAELEVIKRLLSVGLGFGKAEDLR